MSACLLLSLIACCLFDSWVACLTLFILVCLSQKNMSEIMDLSVTLWQRFLGQRSCKILCVITPLSKEIRDFTVSICKSIRPYTWHSLLASLPLSVIFATGIAWCWKEHSKQCCHSEDGFQRELCKLAQVFFAEGCFSAVLRSSSPLSAYFG